MELHLLVAGHVGGFIEETAQEQEGADGVLPLRDLGEELARRCRLQDAQTGPGWVLSVVRQLDHVIHTPGEEQDCGLGSWPRCGVGVLVQVAQCSHTGLAKFVSGPVRRQDDAVALGEMMFVIFLDPGSRILDPGRQNYSGSRVQKSTRSATLVRASANMCQPVPALISYRTGTVARALSNSC